MKNSGVNHWLNLTCDLASEVYWYEPSFFSN